MSDERQPYVASIGLPPGSMAEHSVLVVSFFDAEGVMRYGIRTQGGGNLVNLLGLLEIAKAHLLMEDNE